MVVWAGVTATEIVPSPPVASMPLPPKVAAAILAGPLVPPTRRSPFVAMATEVKAPVVELSSEITAPFTVKLEAPVPPSATGTSVPPAR